MSGFERTVVVVAEVFVTAFILVALYVLIFGEFTVVE